LGNRTGAGATRGSRQLGVGEAAIGIFTEDARVLFGHRKLGFAGGDYAKLSPLAVLGSNGLLRPGSGGSFGLNTDAVERRGGCAGALKRFLRAA
jgi:hypothetical protein